jgi:hypothetical protein
VKGRTESRAFLIWFLENYFRLDDVTSYDSICDGPDDKGIDGIYLDENLERIDVFQSRLLQRTDKGLGDTQLKEFVGTLSQFSDSSTVAKLAESTGNDELKKLILSSNIPDKIEKGYSVRGVFLTNGTRDSSAEQYLSSQANLVLYDSKELQEYYVPIGRTGPVTKPVTFDLYGFSYSEHSVSGVNMIIAPLRATELIDLDGIENQQLFAWNVRQSLGKSKVNKEIGKSIDQQTEHKNFLLYHNGLTILCKSINKDGEKIEISGYSVVNGCQSLTSLYEHKDKVTDDLRILTRLIELDPESELAGKITLHSNNQNPINARDLQSNSIHQIRLQEEFKNFYDGEIFYQIKRGELTTSKKVINNQDAARILLAFDLREPWTCHQTYKLFDELYIELFARPEVNVHRIFALNLVYEAVLENLSKIEDELMGRYGLTKYFILYLLREALEYDDVGKSFCQNPEPFIVDRDNHERLRFCISRVLEDLIIDFNAEIKDRDEAGKPFDYKREFKSPTSVKTLSRDILPHYQKAIARGRALSFGKEWEEYEESD